MLSWAADVALLTADLHEMRSRVAVSSSVSLSSSEDVWLWLSFDEPAPDKLAKFNWLLQTVAKYTVSYINNTIIKAEKLTVAMKVIILLQILF